MKRLLAVSWEMPPLSGPRAVQVTRLLRHLVPLGWASTVVCFGPRSNRYNQDYPIDPAADTGGAIELIRVPSPEESLLFRVLWRVCPPIKLLPDEKWVWINRAVAAGRQAMAANPCDAIVSFGQPWSDHLIGLRLHRESRLPWTAHFSDPWVDNPYVTGFEWQWKIWRRMEHDVVEHASRLVFMTKQTADRTMAKYPDAWTRKVAIIPQGFDPEVAVPETAARVDGPLRMVYTGRFYPGIRTPETVLQALGRLQAKQSLAGRVALDVYGVPFEPYDRLANDLGLAGVVTFYGRVTPVAALAAAMAAGLLLVIDAPSQGPGLFLPMRKPILGVVPADGASADLLRALGCTSVDPLDVDGIARAIGDAIDRWQRGVLTLSASHDDAARAYDIRTLARRFGALLDEALDPVKQ